MIKVTIIAKEIVIQKFTAPSVVRVLTNVVSGGDGSLYPPYYRNISNADLTDSKIILLHNLNTESPTITIFNDQNLQVFPTDFKTVSLSTAELDLTGYTPLINPWRIKVTRE